MKKTKKRTAQPPLDPELLHAWERQPDEPAALFVVFSAYLVISPRSVRRAIGAVRGRMPRQPSGTFTRAAAEWRWRERAQAYDAHAAEETRVVFEGRRRKARERRLDRLEALAGQVSNAVPHMDLVNAEPAVILKAVVELNREEREEFLDTAEDRRTDQEHSAPLPDLETVLHDAPEPRPSAPHDERTQ